MAITPKKRRVSFMDELMAESIRLPGAPQVIVTRGWAYVWLKKLGYPLQGGFASVEYMTFRRPAEQLALTDLTSPWAVALIARMEADCA